MEGDIYFTKSIDTFVIEVKEYKDKEYVEIRNGSSTPLLFPRGDEAPACHFLSDVAQLLGVKIPLKEKKK